MHHTRFTLVQFPCGVHPKSETRFKQPESRTNQWRAIQRIKPYRLLFLKRKKKTTYLWVYITNTWRVFLCFVEFCCFGKLQPLVHLVLANLGFCVLAATECRTIDCFFRRTTGSSPLSLNCLLKSSPSCAHTHNCAQQQAPWGIMAGSFPGRKDI